tara:strand:- start:588 stop:842 length:255 start_codon:yes stop_codon:yes gene_type:complete
MTDYGKIIREEEHKREMLAVDHPPHYNKHGIECITAIEAALGDGFKFYLQGNILKYMWRYEYKNKKEDLLKAQWYLSKLIEIYK